MAKLIINEPCFNKEEIKEDMFIEVKTKIAGNERTFNGVISGVEHNKIWYLVSGGSTFAVSLSDVLDGKDKIKVADSLRYNDLGKMVKQMDIIHDYCDGNSIEIITNDSGETYSKVVVNGRGYIIEPLTPKDFTYNLGTLNLK